MALLSHSHISVLPSTSVHTSEMLVSAAAAEELEEAPGGEWCKHWPANKNNHLAKHGKKIIGSDSQPEGGCELLHVGTL